MEEQLKHSVSHYSYDGLQKYVIFLFYLKSQ